MINAKCVLIIAICFSASSIAQRNINWQQLDSMAMQMHSKTFARYVDTSLKIYYLKPVNLKRTDKKPAVIWIHGGAWKGGKANTFFAHAAYCSLKGAVGISIEYRLLRNEESSIEDCIDDCRKAIDYIKRHARQLNVDTSKIVLVGESAGGHLAAYVAMVASPKYYFRPSALVLYNPVLNMLTPTFLKYLYAPAALNLVPSDTIALMQEHAKRGRRLSPLFLPKNNLPPTLLINGTFDVVTPFSFAKAFADSLQYNPAFHFVSVAGKGHAFAIPHYKESESTVINALLEAGTFLTCLDILSGNINLVPANIQNWLRPLQ